MVPGRGPGGREMDLRLHRPHNVRQISQMRSNSRARKSLLQVVSVVVTH